MGEIRKAEFSQCFGDKAAPEELTEADLLSTVEFNDTGEFLATGDRGGRIVIFQKGEDIKQVTPSGRVKYACKYRFHTEFQSHDSEFDYLKSLEIEEKINQIRWCHSTNNAHFLLSTNDRTIKLWKVQDKVIKAAASQLTPRHEEPSKMRPSSSSNNICTEVSSNNGTNNSDSHVCNSNSRGASPVRRHPDDDSHNNSVKKKSIRFPRLYATGSVTSASTRRIYSNAHSYHINSLSINSDGENFLSADDLRINLWHLEVNDRSYNVVDMKPTNMEDLNEVITCATFHPAHCNIMMYSSSRGTIRMADLRDSALCDGKAKVFEQAEDVANKSFFSEIISSISDAKFTQDGRYVISRDYLTIKVWDTHMESRPVNTISIHESLRAHLCDLYESDCIFDKFECAISGDASHVATGSYNNVFHIHDRQGLIGGSSTEISRNLAKRRMPTAKSIKGGLSSLRRAPDVGEAIDFDKKVLHLAWHPNRDLLAIAGLNRLYFYTV